MTIVYKTFSGFSGNVTLRNLLLNSHSYSFEFLTGCRKCRISVGKLEISQKLHGGDRRRTNVRKKTISKSMSHFHPYANFRYVKIGLCVPLVPCFVEVPHICDFVPPPSPRNAHYPLFASTMLSLCLHHPPKWFCDWWTLSWMFHLHALIYFPKEHLKSVYYSLFARSAVCGESLELAVK